MVSWELRLALEQKAAQQPQDMPISSLLKRVLLHKIPVREHLFEPSCRAGWVFVDALDAPCAHKGHNVTLDREICNAE